jgi:chaperonin GroEL (HSP60 family)
VKAIEVIAKPAVPLDVNDRKTLLKVALTSMSSKAVGSAHVSTLQKSALTQSNRSLKNAVTKLSQT